MTGFLGPIQAGTPREHDVGILEQLLLESQQLAWCTGKERQLIHTVVHRCFRIERQCERERHWRIQPGQHVCLTNICAQLCHERLEHWQLVSVESGCPDWCSRATH